MKVLVLLLFAVYSVTSLYPFSEENEYHFKLWMSQYNKVYDIEEFYHRLQIFSENKRRIDHHNEGNHKFTRSHVSSNGPYPDSVDWRKKGHYVTDVKNQGPCGSCWTFSTTGCLESVTAIATGKLLQLSEQQLVDCAQAFNNHGCKGQAFEYIKYNKGLMTEDDYPYTAHYDEMGMLDAVARYNPVSLAYEVTSDFMHYDGGVYTSMECHNTTDTVNHAVLAVGYGEEKGTPYWIVKNSWGSSWGMKGYFFIERGKNMCGLAACSSYPLPVL
ncbi:unnamed protein product [Coregonus sp. 'balchen']|nr:unnamed protein product [Coregonus sp. 'balchen']